MRSPLNLNLFRVTVGVLAATVIAGDATSVIGQDLGAGEIPSALTSRPVSPRFDHLTLEDGLSQGSVLSLFQDHQGFVWIGSQDGLNRYDGHDFEIFRNQPFDSTTIGSGEIWAIDEDQSGRLWVATLGGGLNLFDPVSETFTRFTHDAADSTSIPSDNLRSLLVASDGTLWVGSRDFGLASTPAANPGMFTRYTHNEDDSTSIGHDDIHGMFEDASGTLWFALHDGLSRMEPAIPGIFRTTLRAADLEPGWQNGGPGEANELWAFHERTQEPGVLWIGTDYGLIRYDTETEEHSRYVANSEDWGSNTVFGVDQDPTNPGVLWASAFGSGLSRFDIRTRRFVVYSRDTSDPNSLLANRTGRIMTDRSGMVWVGTETQGVDRFNPSSIGFAHVQHAPNEENTLPGQVIWAIYQTRDGLIWVSSQEPGPPSLTRLDRSTGEYFTYPNDENRQNRRETANVFSGGGVDAFLEDPQGHLWLAGTPLSRLDRRTGRFRRFYHDEDDPTSMSRSGAHTLLLDQIGNLWIGTWHGLNKMALGNPGAFTRYLYDPDERYLPGHHILSSHEDLAGFIWLGTFEGLVRLDPESGREVRYRHNPRDRTTISNETVPWIHERSMEPGVLWLATSGGLNRFDTESETFTMFSERDGLANNIVYAILEDDDGRLWMSTNNGLSRFDPEAQEFRNYGLEIGLQSLEFDQWSAHRSFTGEMFFGGTNGFNAFFPNQVTENLNAPAVALVDFKLFNRSIKETGAVKLSKPLSETEQIVLDHRQQDVEFDFVALHFADPHSNEFAYMLEGYNDDWVYSGQNRSASFTNLSPGDYTFRVKAANSDGIWNEEGASIRLVITPPFWATWWFRLFGIGLFVGLIYGAYRFRVQQIAARAVELEGQVNERTAELKSSYAQLEQSATIVEAINQETSFSRLLTKILEEARVIRGVEKATALVYSQDDDRFHVRASSGWDVEAMKDIRLKRREARDRYVKNAEEVAEDIFVAKNVSELEGAELMAEFGQVASFLVLRVEVEGDTAGYLVFDNLTDPDAFDQRDVDLLERLREHIQSAFIKTRILEELQTTLKDLQSAQDRLVQTEKMASLGQLTAGIAHEIRNPLNFINNFSEVTNELASDLKEELQKRKADLPADYVAEVEDLVENLLVNASKVNEHGKRAEGIVQNMLEHSKAGEGLRTPVELNSLLDEYVTLAHHGLRAQNPEIEIHVEKSYDKNIGHVDIIPQDMGRVFMNLIGNAFDALKGYDASKNGDDTGPILKISTARVNGPGFDGVEVRVEDNGPGIPEKVKARIFEPFFTTKPTGSGTGLGLSMAYDIVTKGHGGELDVLSEPGEGAIFIVRIPA